MKINKKNNKINNKNDNEKKDIEEINKIVSSRIDEIKNNENNFKIHDKNNEIPNYEQLN